MIVAGDASVWEETSQYDCPWGEVVCKSIVFTMPTDQMHRIENIDETITFLDRIVGMVGIVTSYRMQRPYRVLFDVETYNGDVVSDYPIVMLVDDIDDIFFNRSGPTAGLFKLIMSLSIVSFRDGCFDSMVENALGAFVAALVFSELYPGYNPVDSPVMEMPPLFQALWHIQAKINRTAVVDVMRKCQDPECPVPDVPEDRWIAFVQAMCQATQADLTKMFLEARAIPLSVTATCGGLDPPRAHVM